jgi:signal peptidase I
VSVTTKTKSAPVKPAAKKKEPEVPKKSVLREWLNAGVFALVTATIVKVFAFQNYTVPTGSMERTILVGDFLVASRFTYGAKIPFTDWRLPGFRKVQQNDIVVFDQPRDHVEYVKRCIAVGGQTLVVKNKKLFVDDKEFLLPAEGQFIDSLIRREGISDPDIFPSGANYNRDNYGPVRVPKTGDVVPLTSATYHLYRELIGREGHKVNIQGEQVYVDGKPVKDYTVQMDYYFMMGDNRDNSLDSRYWGFVPETHVLASPLFIYFSWDSNISLLNIIDKLGSIRWSRFGHTLE